MKKLLVCAVFVACADRPPPVRMGKCLADVYDGSRTPSQVCVWEGYRWQCDDLPTGIKCWRLGEATGER